MDKLIIIALAAAVIVLLIASKFMRNKLKNVKEFRKDLDNRLVAYKEFTDLCKKVIETGSRKAYRELNSSAQSILLLAGDAPKEFLNKIIFMTDKENVHSLNKDELYDTCRACTSALYDDLYRKPKEIRKASETSK